MRKLEEERLGLDYWLKWQVPVCALIIAIPTLIAINFIRKREKERAKSESEKKVDDYGFLWVPSWKKMNPIWLLIYRASAFVSMVILLYRMVALMGFFAFYFYTQWTFALVMIYFGIATIVSIRGCSGMYAAADADSVAEKEKDTLLKKEAEKERNSRRASDNKDSGTINSSSSSHNKKQYHYEQKTPSLETLMQIIYQTCAGAAVLTDLVFWCILVPMLAGIEFEVTLLIAAIHSVNALFLIFDSTLNTLPFEWPGFAYFVIWSVLYTVFQWILHAIGFTWWPYPFLDLATPWAPLWYLALAAVHVPCYGLYLLLVKTKDLIFSKLFPHAFLRSSQWTLRRGKAA